MHMLEMQILHVHVASILIWNPRRFTSTCTVSTCIDKTPINVKLNAQLQLFSHGFWLLVKGKLCVV